MAGWCLGALDHIKELCRDARGTRWIDEAWQDLRFAARLLARERWVAAGAVLALGLGLGISGAAFTAYNGLLLRGLPMSGMSRPAEALGAGAGQMGWMVLRGLAPVGIGFAAGIWGALTVGRLFESWLVETPPTDPVTQRAVAALLGAVSVAACVRPARRAARLDPVVALRHE